MKEFNVFVKKEISQEAIKKGYPISERHVDFHDPHGCFPMIKKTDLRAWIKEENLKEHFFYTFFFI